MYKKAILKGFCFFLIFWIILPLTFILIGKLIIDGSFDEWTRNLGKILSGFGFVFSMIAASYMLTDGGGAPINCCPPKELVTCGPYSMCRHPVYLGFTLYIIGLALTYGSIGSIIVTGVASFLLILWTFLREEKKLMKKFPEYAEYKKSTPAFIPKLPKKSEICPPLFFNLLFVIGHVLTWFTWDIRFVRNFETPKKGFVVVANHVTYLDFAVIIYALSRFISFPVSLFHYERHKWLYKNVGCFPIKRHEPDLRAIVRIINYVKKGGRLGIFPEAERSWDGRFLGFKEGFDKLLQKLPKPIVAVRIEKAHLLFPRWGKKFYPGKVFVKVKFFDDPKEVEKFLSEPSVGENDIYPSYKGVENYIYMCPKCGKVNSIVSFKTGFRCSNCGFYMEKPTVGQLWKLHDEIKEKLKLPYSETCDMIDPYGRVVKKNVVLRATEEGIYYNGELVKLGDVKNYIAEGRKEIFLSTKNGFIGFRVKTSALLWKDLMDKILK